MADTEARFTTRKAGQVTVVRLTREHISDIEYVDALGDELMRTLEAARPCDLLIDFSAVAFLTSSFLGKIIALTKRTAELGGRLRLCGLRPRILEIFRLVQLDRKVEILPTAADALGPQG